ncbi:phage minor capsid protein [Streptococcus cuniculi]|uniref:Capsid protein n=1 Tax=Streptococcus cuniculi TaxID=1432788 RepID=A0A4Y9JDJ5_9STRE|nr:phage minor capsid protein [Streptococcus cuniculi]MBF0778173.1 phage minor capsid protein [Streptococcus cuniculi]TFU97915.1 capsid protein [Streptococcus cuniculi]
MNKLPFEQGDEQFELEMMQVADIYRQLSIELFENIIRRLKKRGTADLIREPYIWQLEKLNDMYMLTEENVKLIAKRSEVAESVLRDVIENEGYKVYQDVHEQLAHDLGVSSLPNRYGTQAALKAYANQTVLELGNLINTTLPRSVQEVYRSIIEQTVAGVVIGSKSADKALSETLMKWFDKGFYGFTDKAGRAWRAEAYARTVIKTTTFRVYRDMRERPAAELGVDTFYYSKKISARAMCSPLQHQIVTKGASREQDGVSILSLGDYGYGTAGGCLGINCGHFLTPFVVGVNRKPDLPDYLKNVTPEQAEENARVQAQQRAFEREIRKNKERLHIAKAIGDEELIQKYRLKGVNLNATYRAYIDEHPFLARRVNRERYYYNPDSYAKQEIRLRKSLASRKDKVYNKSVESMKRNKDPNKRRPVPVVRQKALTKAFRERGGKVWQDSEAFAYLNLQGADAICLGKDLIVLQKKPIISEILEELYHANQHFRGEIDTNNRKSIIEAEIAAQKYLLSVTDKYSVPKSEVEQTRKALKAYLKELEGLENEK